MKFLSRTIARNGNRHINHLQQIRPVTLAGIGIKANVDATEAIADSLHFRLRDRSIVTRLVDDNLGHLEVLGQWASYATIDER